MTKDTRSEEHTLERLREYHRTLESISRIGAEMLPPIRLMQHVAAQISRVTHIERTKVMRYRPEKGDLLVEAGVGWDAGVVGHATLVADHRSPAGRALQTGGPVATRNLYDPKEFVVPDLLREHGIVSLLNVPIMINGLTWGVLEVDSTKPSSFDEWDVGFMTMVANILGVCIALHEAQQDILEERSQRERERAQNNISVREIQHRIKNNFQIIIAFLSLKMRHSSAEVREKLTSVVGRIQAISLAHDLLSIGKQTSTVDFSDYLRSLCANIDPQRPDVAIEIEAERAEIPIDRAVPAGLVVNELVTNSIKYAFANAGGRIRVHFAQISNSSEGCISVEDDGEGIAVPPKKGLGLTLVEKLAQQIQGRVEYAGTDRGTKIVLCFPVAM